MCPLRRGGGLFIRTLVFSPWFVVPHRVTKYDLGAQPPRGGLAKAVEACRGDIGTQPLMRGPAKAAEARRVDIGAQPPKGGNSSVVHLLLGARECIRWV